MSNFFAMPSLRSLIVLDAVTCAAMGAMLAVGSAFIAERTSLPPALLAGAGIVLLPIAAFMLLVATRRSMPGLGVLAIVVGNAFWVVGSLAALAMTAPNALGTVFVIAQAIGVAVLAILEFTTWRGAALSPRMG